MDLPLDDIKALVDYLYEEEATDFEQMEMNETNMSPEALEAAALEQRDEKHVFSSVVRVKNWLDSLHKKPGERHILLVENEEGRGVLTVPACTCCEDSDCECCIYCPIHGIAKREGA